MTTRAPAVLKTSWRVKKSSPFPLWGHLLQVTALALSAHRPFRPTCIARGLDDVWLRFWSKCLVKILKLKFDKDLFKNSWYELNPRVRCAFGNVFDKCKNPLMVAVQIDFPKGRRRSRCIFNQLTRTDIHCLLCSASDHRSWKASAGFIRHCESWECHLFDMRKHPTQGISCVTQTLHQALFSASLSCLESPCVILHWEGGAETDRMTE